MVLPCILSRVARSIGVLAANHLWSHSQQSPPPSTMSFLIHSDDGAMISSLQQPQFFIHLYHSMPSLRIPSKPGHRCISGTNLFQTNGVASESTISLFSSACMIGRLPKFFVIEFLYQMIILVQEIFLFEYIYILKNARHFRFFKLEVARNIEHYTEK